MTKKYYIIESSNGSKTLEHFCKGIESLELMGELNGMHLITKPPKDSDQVPHYLMFKPF